VWRIEDEIGAIEVMNFNAKAVSDNSRDFYRSYADLVMLGERKLQMESIVQGVVVGKNKKMTVTLRPPLLVFITLILALR
jgi:hypothetical protein